MVSTRNQLKNNLAEPVEPKIKLRKGRKRPKTFDYFKYFFFTYWLVLLCTAYALLLYRPIRFRTTALYYRKRSFNEAYKKDKPYDIPPSKHHHEIDAVVDADCSGVAKSNFFGDIKKFIIRRGISDEWKLNTKILNARQLEKYFFKKDISFQHNNKANCTICKGGEKHEMRAKYTKSCRCSSPFCSLLFKAIICCKELNPKKQEVKVYQKGKCYEKKFILKRATENRGISMLAKPFIDRMMSEDMELTAKQCHSMLMNSHKVSDTYLPKLAQIQGYFRRKKRRINTNNIEEMIEKIASQQYSELLSESDPFFFHVKKSDTGKVLLQNGSPTAHTHIMLSSKKLMMNCEKRGVFHIDGTYKLLKNGFPLVVIGVSDIRGQFHPIAFCITSNEEEGDFTEFYLGMIKLANKMDLEFDPDYIMQDSCFASYNAAKNAKLDATILMCYFHVMANIKKRYATKLGLEAWRELHGHIFSIHMSRSVDEMNKLIKKFTKRYKTEKTAADDLFTYVNTQWLTGVFNKWMIFNNEPGWANTNSNIESFNAVIKRDFFKRKRFSVYGAILIKSSINTMTHTILVQNKSCSCSHWLKKKICVHSLAYSNLNDLNWFGSSYSGKALSFFNKAKRGAKKGGRVKNAEPAYIRGD